jgi:hypothetical protein
MRRGARTGQEVASAIEVPTSIAAIRTPAEKLVSSDVDAVGFIPAPGADRFIGRVPMGDGVSQNKPTRRVRAE